jgi:hypothetical protein
MRPPCEALRIAVDQTRPQIANVVSFDSAAAHRAMLFVARYAVIDENE